MGARMKMITKKSIEAMVYEASEACCAASCHSLKQTPKNGYRELYAVSYDKGRQSTLDDTLRRGTTYRYSSDYNDVLRDMHLEQGGIIAPTKDTAEDAAYIRNSYAQIEKLALQMVGHLAEKVTEDDYVQTMSKLVDHYVAGVLIFGNDVDSLDYAESFMREMRQRLANAGCSQDTMIKLARVEDKIAMGRESADVMQKKLIYPNGAQDLFEHAAHIIVLNRPETHPDRENKQLSKEETVQAYGLAARIYAQQLQSFGMSNDPLPQLTFYGFALMQQAMHVAEAEFMRLPKEHPCREGDQVEGRKRYNTERVPEILREVLMRHPPVPKDVADGERVEPLTVVMHDTDALFSARRTLSDMQQRAAGRARG